MITFVFLVTSWNGDLGDLGVEAWIPDEAGSVPWPKLRDFNGLLPKLQWITVNVWDDCTDSLNVS